MCLNHKTLHMNSRRFWCSHHFVLVTCFMSIFFYFVALYWIRLNTTKTPKVQLSDFHKWMISQGRVKNCPKVAFYVLPLYHLVSLTYSFPKTCQGLYVIQDPNKNRPRLWTSSNQSNFEASLCRKRLKLLFLGKARLSKLVN